MRRFDWTLLLYIIIFIVALLLGLKYSYDITKNILFTLGIVFCCFIILVFRARQKIIKKKKTKKIPGYVD